MEEGTCGREGAAVGRPHWQALNTSWARRRDDTAQKEERERGRARHVGKRPSMIAENDMYLLTPRAEGLTNPKRSKLAHWLANCANRFPSPGGEPRLCPSGLASEHFITRDYSLRMPLVELVSRQSVGRVLR